MKTVVVVAVVPAMMRTRSRFTITIRASIEEGLVDLAIPDGLRHAMRLKLKCPAGNKTLSGRMKLL